MEDSALPSSNNIRPDPGRLWAGGAATAVVAALIAVVGVLVCRWTLAIPILAPQSDGAWGSAHTGEFALATALIALAATAVLHLLMLGTPQPGVFLKWIMGLITVIAGAYPFSTGAPLDQKVATAAVNVVLGIAITSLLSAVAVRAVRRVPSRDVLREGYGRGSSSGYGPGGPGGSGYGPGGPGGYEGGYGPGGPGGPSYGPGGPGGYERGGYGEPPRGYDRGYGDRDGYGRDYGGRGGYGDRGYGEPREYGRSDYERGPRDYDRGEAPTRQYPPQDGWS
ncbi:MAG: hypothetical protein J2P25_10655 [Nocardiopsaceae bacterium]|nr:hypothetical protein [Nocardiopsaceae bacterium]